MAHDQQDPEPEGAKPLHLTTAGTTFEAEIIIERLAEAGIQAVPLESTDPRVGMLGRCDIYVQEPDIARARAVLEADESFSEDELVRLEEEDAARRHIPPRPE
jgi:hypothetical protein